MKLRNGTEVLLRPIRPSDKELLVVGLGRLSDETVYRRFLAPKPRLTGSDLRYLTEVDGVRHVATIAVLADEPDVLVGVARFICDREDPTAAEIAVVVADPLQGQGLGAALGRDLAERAVALGVDRFTATMLATNEPAHRLFTHISDHLEVVRDGAYDELVARLAA